jgi:hypothetical protein
MDRLSDTDFNSWFKAAWHLDLNCLTNEAFHYASGRPATYSAPMPMTYPAPPHTPFSFLHSHAPTATTCHTQIRIWICNID